ncbi:SCP2 sterol-binding domain-containing protein [Rheinheimera sp.]|uniref:ubiquinone biosynthesis accessory factor UbiJ n=1 Tax=Rheinheimera sp. TaxID=1869214 RepID=UPI00307DB6E9
MLNLLPQLLCAAFEKVLQKLLAMDPTSVQLLAPVQGKQLALQLKELPWRFVLSASERQLLLNQHLEQADCEISTDLTTVRQLADPSQLTRLIKQDKLSIQGDLQVAQKFSQVLQQLDPDWQQELSVWLGDALAHKLATALRQVQQLLLHKLAELQQQSVELLQDELQSTPSRAEFQQFQLSLTSVQTRLEQLSRQLKTLQES